MRYLPFVFVFLQQVYATYAGCPPLPFPEHGHFIMYGSEVKVVCDSGYRYHSQKRPTDIRGILRCNWKNKWTEPNPRCVLNYGMCLPPKPVSNGRIIQEGPYYIGNSITYMCDNGHIHEGGNLDRTCQKNLEWTGLDPICIEWNIETIADKINDQFVDKLEQHGSGLRRNIPRDVELEGLDLILLFDMSSSIQGIEFSKGIQFAKFLIDKFNVSNGPIDKVGGTRLGVFTFSSDTNLVMAMGNASINSTEIAKNEVDKIKCGEFCEGGTNIQGALARVNAEFKSKSRKKAKKALFITTDGEPSLDPTTKSVSYYSTKLKETGVEIFTCGIGSEVDEDTLGQMASEPPSEHVFVLESFDEFDNIIAIIHDKEIPTPPPPADSTCGYGSEQARKERLNMKTGSVNPGTWPWLAAVSIADQNTNHVRFGCSGVLYSKRWVFVPASCLHVNGTLVEPSNIYVVLGATNLAKENDNQQYFYATKVVVRDKFNPNVTSEHDIAFIQLNEPPVLNDYVRMACLPETESHKLSMPDTPGIVVGWLTPNKYVKRIPGLPLTASNASQIQLLINSGAACEVIRPSKYFNCKSQMFSARSGNNMDKECMGDIGASFHFVEYDGKATVYGIASHSEGCTLGNKKMFFVPLTIHVDWICHNTECMDIDYDDDNDQ